MGCLKSTILHAVKEMLQDMDPTSPELNFAVHHSITKRHGNHNQPRPPVDEELGEAPPNLIELSIRCSHVSAPTVLFTTPLLGDFDLDGQLDIVYIVAWSSAYFQAYKTLVVASNLERLFVRAYGKGILDFDTFLPFSQQPWTQYMGRHGDNIFKMTPKT